MDVLQIAILALIQGLAELLPVSSSAHVILAEKLMGLDPGTPQMFFLLVMLHTGTMFAALIYFWSRWMSLLREGNFIKNIVIATGVTGFLGLGLKKLIEKGILEGLLGHPYGEVEHLARSLPLVALALFSAGLLILYASFHEPRAKTGSLSNRHAFWIGAIQGLCLPFRGFSRSGATISTGLILGISRDVAESFSFALAVVLTPPVLALELYRLMKSVGGEGGLSSLAGLVFPGLLGMAFSFIAGLFALRWLSSWLEKGRWKYFGYYCLGFSGVVFGASYF